MWKLKPPRVDRLRLLTDLSSVIVMSREWEVKCRRLNHLELLRLAFSIVEGLEPHPDIPEFPFRFRQRSIMVRGVATDCVHIFRQLTAVNVLADHWDAAAGATWGTQAQVKALGRAIRLRRLVASKGDLPDELRPAVLSDDAENMAVCYMLLISATHVGLQEQSEALLGRSMRTANQVWSEAKSLAGPVGCHLKCTARQILLAVATEALLRFERVPGVYDGTPGAVADAFADLHACHRRPPARLAQLYDGCYRGYKSGAPKLIQAALGSDVPLTLAGDVHGLSISEPTVDKDVGELFAF